MIQIRAVTNQDRAWVVNLIVERWHSERVVSRGRLHSPADLPGFIASDEHRPLGLVTYHIENDECELVTIDSLSEGLGVGSALLEAIRETAIAASCSRLWLITTNDNLPALRFYQRRGYSLVALHRNALERSRELKPEIPATGHAGIPLRDELELEIRFAK